MLVMFKSISSKADIKEIERLKRMVIRGVTTSLKKRIRKEFQRKELSK